MSNNIFWHLVAVFVSSTLPVYWIGNPTLNYYTLQACGVTIILYFVTKKTLQSSNHKNSLDLFFLNLITQTLVVSTGGATSPLFFLYYFVLFAFSVYYEPFQALSVSIFTAISLLYLSPSLLTNFDPHLLNIFSILLIAPLATVYSKAIIKNEQSKLRINSLEVDLIQSENDSLLWITTESQPTLNKTINAITDLIIYLTSTRSQITFPKAFLTKIKSIQSDLLTLYSSSELFEQDIKNKTDKVKKQL